ncbi:hypothetical protein [Streptomyces sp. NPDC048636]|uniref:hypothetical protein n=1 Tax=Streptomyces sp. NPDC048636 TaxID=3155762 RepID=UPI00343348BD
MSRTTKNPYWGPGVEGVVEAVAHPKGPDGVHGVFLLEVAVEEERPSTRPPSAQPPSQRRPEVSRWRKFIVEVPASQWAEAEGYFPKPEGAKGNMWEVEEYWKVAVEFGSEHFTRPRLSDWLRARLGLTRKPRNVAHVEFLGLYNVPRKDHEESAPGAGHLEAGRDAAR